MPPQRRCPAAHFVGVQIGPKGHRPFPGPGKAVQPGDRSPRTPTAPRGPEGYPRPDFPEFLGRPEWPRERTNQQTTPYAETASRVIHRSALTTTGKELSVHIGFCCQVVVDNPKSLLPSGHGSCCQVVVDNLSCSRRGARIGRTSPGEGQPPGQTVAGRITWFSQETWREAGSARLLPAVGC